MAYASWSVVFGEQPSAAKWNILGTNDASFNDGSGIKPTNAIVAASGSLDLRGNSTGGVKVELRTQTDNSNSIASATTSGIRFQTGWGQLIGTGATTLNDTVTFPTAFSAILGAVVTHAGAKTTGSSATAITDASLGGYGGGQGLGIEAVALSTTTMLVSLTRANGTFSAANWHAYTWIAWGT